MKIGLIGAGNVAWNLMNGLRNSPFRIVQVHSRGGTSAADLAQEFGIESHGADPSSLRQDLDLVIIATSDHSVPDVAEAYAGHLSKDTVAAHTSGSMPLRDLEPLGENVGVFYPLQTFTKGLPTDWKVIPFYLEGNAAVLELLRPVAEYLSDRVYDLDSEGRLRLHLGAVFASNFANFMWLLAERVVADLPDADATAYVPLIREVTDKFFELGPVDAQTGPARRGDQVTMDKHLSMLQGENKQVYELLSRMIAEHYLPD